MKPTRLRKEILIMSNPTKLPEPKAPAAETKSQKFAREFREAVLAQIGGDKNHGWGLEDSFSVIDSLCDIEPEAAPFIREVINPSAFRQVLEKRELLNKAPESGRRNNKPTW
jgi:hypothetical protein